MTARRHFMKMLAAATVASTSAIAHTPYGQWIVYRKKHLLIGCHREDPETYILAKAVVQDFEHDLEEANARVARAPRPERRASLLATDQMDVAILDPASASEMSAGTGRFGPYGEIPLCIIGSTKDHIFVGHERMPERHAWLIAMALDSGGNFSVKRLSSTSLALHPGAAAYADGLEVPDMPSSSTEY
jgi:hypothetical protein